MKNFKIILIILASVSLTFLLGLFLIGYFRPKSGGLSIETTPVSLVYIDGVQVGKTPYEVTRPPGEITIRLEPQSAEKSYFPFETKITLTSGIKTVVRRVFAETEEASSGEIISFEKTSKSEVSLSVVSIPDAAQVSIDGQPRGFTSLKTSSILAGDHQLIISAPGYQEKTLLIKTVAGYKLTAFVKLAPAENPQASPQPTPIPIESKNKISVEILSTPNGFLRVRSKPTISGEELAQVKPGEKFLLLEEDKASGWFKIEYQLGKEGWVSNQYVKKIEESSPKSI